jgi:hypothetical protein
MRWAEHVSEWVVLGKPEGKKPLGRPRHKFVDNIKMELVDIRLGGLVWKNGELL